MSYLDLTLQRRCEYRSRTWRARTTRIKAVGTADILRGAQGTAIFHVNFSDFGLGPSDYDDRALVGTASAIQANVAVSSPGSNVRGVTNGTSGPTSATSDFSDCLFVITASRRKRFRAFGRLPTTSVHSTSHGKGRADPGMPMCQGNA
jgi:hypothetical protein